MSSWKIWGKNSLQLDLDPTSFLYMDNAAILSSLCLSTFSDFSHLFKLFLPSTFQLFSLFSPFEALPALLLYNFSAFSVFFRLFNLFQTSYSTAFSLLQYSSFCLFTSFKHLASCSAMKMFNFSNSLNPLRLFCPFIFLNVHLSTFSPPPNIKLHVQVQKLFSYQYVQIFRLVRPLTFQLFNLFSFFIFSAVRSADFASAFSMHTVFSQEIRIFLVSVNAEGILTIVLLEFISVNAEGTKRLSASSSPSCFELETPFQL